MASIQKFRKKWKAFVRRGKVTAVKTFTKKSDASKWAYKVEAQIETGSYKRVKDAEKLADIFNIFGNGNTNNVTFLINDRATYDCRQDLLRDELDNFMNTSLTRPIQSGKSWINI